MELTSCHHGVSGKSVTIPGEIGTPVAEIFRKARISEATYFNRKKIMANLMLDWEMLPNSSSRVLRLDRKRPSARMLLNHHTADCS